MRFAKVLQASFALLFADFIQMSEAKPLPFTLMENKLLALNTDILSFQTISNDLKGYNSEFYNVKLRHKILSLYTSPLEAKTMCYYNIHQEDRHIFLEATRNHHGFEDLDNNELKSAILDIKKDIEQRANTGRRLISANDFDETTRSCVLKYNDVARIGFLGEIVVSNVEYYIDLHGKTQDYPDIINYKRGKILMSYPLNGYKYECLHGNEYCDLKSEPFSTDFD